MNQQPILNEHNLAEGESKANPVCFAEPKQGHELNAHNKQEYPPMHTDRIDSSLMINIANIENACLEYKEEVFTSLTEAKKYLSEFDWCIKILDGWVAASFGYILNIFLFKIKPDNKTCPDEYVWIIVGDIPPAYIDVVSAQTASDALNSYIEVMQDWVEKVKDGDSIEEYYPVNVTPEAKYANMLATRLKMLKEDFFPIITKKNSQMHLI